VKALRILVHLLPALAAWLLLSAQPAGRDTPVHGAAVLASHERDGRPAVDLVTRKQRHAASLGEYFAVDDDAEQYAQSPPQVAVVRGRSTWVTPRSEPRLCYREPLPSHRPCAAPSTGPPHA
jgi:hypothetical protein